MEVALKAEILLLGEVMSDVSERLYLISRKTQGHMTDML
jgi:hypothetical protein